MNYFTKKRQSPSTAAPRVIACKLDSKARLVLPLVVREKLSVSKGDCVLFEIEFSESQALLKLSKTKMKALARPNGSLKQFSRNGWEK